MTAAAVMGITTVCTMNEIFWNALIAGLALSALAGPLGCFVVWRRMAYLGDTMAHAALLGVSLSLIGLVPLQLGIFIVAALIAVLMVSFTSDTRLHSDTTLGILSHGMLSLGLVVLALMSDARVDVMAYLFGDILALGMEQVFMIVGLSCMLLALTLRLWRIFLLATIHTDIAQVEGLDVKRVRLLLMLLLAGVIAVAIKLVGALLITALLIIPAAAARFWSIAPMQMAWLASIIGAISVGVGLLAAFQLDTPASPTIVVAAFAAFIVSWVVQRQK